MTRRELFAMISVGAIAETTAEHPETIHAPFAPYYMGEIVAELAAHPRQCSLSVDFTDYSEADAKELLNGWCQQFNKAGSRHVAASSFGLQGEVLFREMTSNGAPTGRKIGYILISRIEWAHLDWGFVRGCTITRNDKPDILLRPHMYPKEVGRTLAGMGITNCILSADCYCRFDESPTIADQIIASAPEIRFQRETWQTVIRHIDYEKRIVTVNTSTSISRI